MTRPTAWTPPAAEWLAIGVGGAMGALLRFAIARTLESGAAHPALATFVVNLTGAFALGLLFARIERQSAPPLLRPFLVIGFFGSFTTFSALVFDARGLASTSGEAIALLHLIASMALGLVGYSAGSRFAFRWDEGERSNARSARGPRT